MPGIMIAQMECIMYTKVLRPLSNRVLSGLRDLVTENKREHWLTIYLAMFILLHSCAMLTRRDWETAREYGLQVCLPSNETFADGANPAYHHAGYVRQLGEHKENAKRHDHDVGSLPLPEQGRPAISSHIRRQIIARLGKHREAG